MEAFIDQLIQSSNIPESSVILLLVLPIVATIISFARHFIGVKSFGIYTPIILTFAYYQLGIQASSNDSSNFIAGIKYGIVVTIIILIAATLTHWATRKLQLHYLPKMSIVITVTSFSVLCALIFGGILRRFGFVSLDIFPLLIIATITEDFISAYNKKNLKFALKLSIESIALAILCYYIITIKSFQDILLAHPWIVLISIIINLFIGRWTGLRLSEYFRFESIMNQNEPSEDLEK